MNTEISETLNVLTNRCCTCELGSKVKTVHHTYVIELFEDGTCLYKDQHYTNIIQDDDIHYSIISSRSLNVKCSVLSAVFNTLFHTPISHPTWMTVLRSVCLELRHTSWDQSSSPVDFTLNSVSSLFSRIYEGNFCLAARQLMCSLTTACPSWLM